MALSMVQRIDLRVVMHELSNDDPSTHSECPFVVASCVQWWERMPICMFANENKVQWNEVLATTMESAWFIKEMLRLVFLQWINTDDSNHTRFSISNFKNQELKKKYRLVLRTQKSTQLTIGWSNVSFKYKI